MFSLIMGYKEYFEAFPLGYVIEDTGVVLLPVPLYVVFNWPNVPGD